MSNPAKNYKDKITEVDSILLEQLHRLNVEDISKETLESELMRAKAIVEVAERISKNVNSEIKMTEIKANAIVAMANNGYISGNQFESIKGLLIDKT